MLHHVVWSEAITAIHSNKVEEFLGVQKLFNGSVHVPGKQIPSHVVAYEQVVLKLYSCPY